jgi:DNA-binding MarR family transcriptional regulator
VDQNYLEAIKLIERLHRHFLEVVKAELDRIGIADINNVQSLILWNIGGEDLTVGDLTHRGYYLGSNVSYNVKKMVENGYLLQERSSHDRRSVRLRLSNKGLALCEHIAAMFDRHGERLASRHLTPDRLGQTNATLHDIERMWTEALAFPLRQPTSTAA